ncbi:Outer membrane lipoprotein slyB precursor [Cronobacter sakazakii]|nr:Outer membrane lipoprotein slyB precursor [Cronobacter sakazakii]
MISRVLVVALAGVTLAGCVNNDSLSGDVYTASEAKQVQNVTYGTVVNVRPVKIQGGDDTNVIGALGGAVLGGFLGNTVGGGTVVRWQRRQALSQAAWQVRAFRAQ